MIKKSIFAVALVAAMCAFATPAHAQFGKKLGKSLGKAAKDAGNAVATLAGDAATEMAANKVSDKIAEFMDKNNTVSAADSEYTKRLATIVGTKFADVDGKALNFAVYESNEANIITLNNGTIRIYSGMMDVLSDDQLQALIGIQAGHLASGNVRDNLMKVASEDNASNAGTAQLDKLLSMSGDGLGTIVNELLQVPYTEEQNQAADKFAATYLKTQGVDAEALYSLASKFSDLRDIDLEDEDLDEEDKSVLEATMAAKFLNVNGNR